MWFKNEIRDEIYHYYLQGIPIFDISQLYDDLRYEDVEEIIDYLNQFYA